MTAAEPTEQGFAATARRIYQRGVYRFDFAEAEFLLNLSLVDNEIDPPGAAGIPEQVSRAEREDIARTVIERIIEELGQEMQLVMGTARRVRRRNQTHRCREAAKVIGLKSTNSYRYYRERIAPQRVDEFAKTLYRLEQRAARQRAAAGKGPSDSLALSWLRRHEHYSDVWTAVWAIQADIVALLDRRHSGHGIPGEPLVISSLYWWGIYWLTLANFRETHHGLWILADSDAEQDAANALNEIGLLPGVEGIDYSWLRDFMREIDHQELDRFARWLPKDPRGVDLLDQWRSWLDSCQCVTKPTDRCSVHTVIRQCQIFTTAIDEDWYSVVGWYRTRPKVHDDIARYEYLRRVYGPRPDETGH